LAVSPSSFGVSPGGTTTLTATLTSGGSPLAGKTITWTKTAGDVYPSSGTTDSQGRATTTYTAPSTEGSVTITASFPGDSDYLPYSGNATGSIQTGSEHENLWLWLIVAYFVISSILAMWVYKDSGGRKMRRGAWAVFTFLTSVAGLAVYLKKRKPRRRG
jgi:hypothetical protein